SSVLGGLVDFAVGFGILLIMMAAYGYWPGPTLLLVPVFIVLAILTSLAVGTWLAALNAVYRDVEYTLPFVTQLWMFLTPIAYPAALVPERWRWLYGLNPMTGVVEGFRWAMFGTSPPGAVLVVSAAVVIVLLVGGLVYFRQMEQVFADVI